jgi:hypothetical protein
MRNLLTYIMVTGATTLDNSPVEISGIIAEKRLGSTNEELRGHVRGRLILIYY